MEENPYWTIFYLMLFLILLTSIASFFPSFIFYGVTWKSGRTVMYIYDTMIIINIISIIFILVTFFNHELRPAIGLAIILGINTLLLFSLLSIYSGLASLIVLSLYIFSISKLKKDLR